MNKSIRINPKKTLALRLATAALLMFFLRLLPGAASAASVYWTNTAGGNWSVAANWNTGTVPGSGDDAFIISNGTYTVTLDVGATVNSLTVGAASGQQIFSMNGPTLNLNGTSSFASNTVFNLNGGTLGGGGSVLVNGTLNWTGGSVYGVLTVASNGVLNLSGSANEYLYAVLTNYGTINWSGGNWYVLNDGSSVFAAVYNQPGGLVDVQGDLTFAYDPYAPYGFVVNAGTFRKSAGSGVLQVSIGFDNSGTVDVESGTLALASGGTVGGQFTTASGAAINLEGGAFVQSGSPVFGGSGQSQFSGGTLTLFGSQIPGLALNGGTLLLSPAFEGGSITNLMLTGVALSGTNTVTGTLNWTGGSVYGVLTVASNGVLNLSGSANEYLYAVLTNYGTINWSGGNWYVLNDGSSVFAAVYNQPGGLVDVQGDLTFAYDPYAPYGFVVNAGTFRKSAGSGVLQVSIGFDNSGTVDVESGTLALASGGTVGGQFTTASGAAINLEGGAFVQSGSPVFGGSGQSQFSGGTLTLFGSQIPGLALNGGTLLLSPAFEGGSITNLMLTGVALSGTNTVTGTLNWTGGSVYGVLTVASNGVLNLSGSANEYLYAVLTNYGTINWSGGNWYVLNDGSSVFAAVYNQPGGLVDVQGDLTFAYDPYAPYGFVVNAGTFRKSAGSGVLQVSIGFDNSGTVDVESGTLALASGGTVGGQFTTASGAAINLEGGAFVQSGSPVFGGSGQSQFSGGTLTLFGSQIPGLALNGGTLLLSPAFEGGSITNLMLTGVALSGTNTVTGTLNWTGGSVYGVLTVASNGVLNLSGSANEYLYAVLTNYGTINWSGGNWYVLNDGSSVFAAVYNQPGGLVDVQGDLTFAYDPYAPYGFVVNAGTFRKSAGSGVLQVSIGFDNSGTVDANIGTIYFGSNGIIDGEFNAAGGTAINFNGSFTSGATPVLNGAGLFGFDGGALGGSGILTINGVMDWLGGTIGCPLTVSSNGVLNLMGNVSAAGALTNAGTINWLSGNIFLDNNTNDYPNPGPIVNLTNGLWNITCDQNLYAWNNVGVTAYFQNAGTVRKSANTGTTYIEIPFDNIGAVNALEGTINFADGGAVDGVFSAAAGAGIVFSAGSFTTEGDYTFSGSIQFVGGKLTLLILSGRPLTPYFVIVNGGDLDGSGGTIIIGEDQNAAMFISAGTATNIGSLYVGYSSGFTGTFDQSGGTVVVTTNLILGNCISNASGAASLSGGALYVTNAAHTAVLDVRDGTFLINTGALLVVDTLVLTNPCAHLVNSGGTLIASNIVLDPDLSAVGDGIPNWWKELYGFDPFDPKVAGADPEHKGMSNLAEYLAGTDPLDPTSVFETLNCTVTNNVDVVVAWTTEGGHSYVLQRATNNATGLSSFVDLSPVITVGGSGPGTTNFVHQGAATNQAGYYRVRLGP